MDMEKPIIESSVLNVNDEYKIPIVHVFPQSNDQYKSELTPKEIAEAYELMLDALIELHKDPVMNRIMGAANRRRVVNAIKKAGC